MNRPLRYIVLFCLFFPSCLSGGPGAGLGGGSFSGPGDSGEASVQDTPPIAGPSEDQDAKPEIPIGECEEENGINCPEKLDVSRTNLCLRTNLSLNPILTLSQATVSAAKPLTSTGQVTLKIWRYTDSSEASPDGAFAAPTLDLEATEPDLDPVKKYTQLSAAPDGTVSFHLVAGQKTGYYEFWVFGDLDTAFGNLNVVSCDEAPGDTLAPNPPPQQPPPAPAFKAK